MGKPKLFKTLHVFSDVWQKIGYNAVIYISALAAYPLSVKDFVDRKVFAALFIFVMIFTVPLIFTYLNVKNLSPDTKFTLQLVLRNRSCFILLCRNIL